MYVYIHVMLLYFPTAPPPGQVTATPLARPGQIYINWTQPPSELQGFTRGYLVRYREHGTTDRHIHSDTSSYMNTILMGLKIGTVYELEVAYVIPTIGLYSPPVLVQTFDGEPSTKYTALSYYSTVTSFVLMIM